jgi:hypothetical protein
MHMSNGRSRGPVDSHACREESSRFSGLDEDIALAARVTVPVLISGPPTESLEIACELDRRIGRPSRAVKVVDCLRPGAVSHLLLLAEPALTRVARTRPRVVLLQEIHALSVDEQLRLTAQFDEVRPPACTIRIVSSSSRPLFDCVAAGHFHETLYYRLNIIHIVVPTEL